MLNKTKIRISLNCIFGDIFLILWILRLINDNDAIILLLFLILFELGAIELRSDRNE